MTRNNKESVWKMFGKSHCIDLEFNGSRKTQDRGGVERGQVSEEFKSKFSFFFPLIFFIPAVTGEDPVSLRRNGNMFQED